MSFIRFWIGFTMFGLAAAVVLLLWAFRTRQFREPDRAACLPLADAGTAAAPVRWSRETVVLLAFLGVGLALLLATVVFAAVW
jgi:cbb3-type cytochrome oxidase subunit 3